MTGGIPSKLFLEVLNNAIQEKVEAVRFYDSRRSKDFAVPPPYHEHEHINLIRLFFNVTAVGVCLWSLPTRPRLSQDPDGRCASPGAHGLHLDSSGRRYGTVLEEARRPNCACSRLVLRSVDRAALASGGSHGDWRLVAFPRRSLEVLRVSRPFSALQVITRFLTALASNPVSDIFHQLALEQVEAWWNSAGTAKMLLSVSKLHAGSKRGFLTVPFSSDQRQDEFRPSIPLLEEFIRIANKPGAPPPPTGTSWAGRAMDVVLRSRWQSLAGTDQFCMISTRPACLGKIGASSGGFKQLLRGVIVDFRSFQHCLGVIFGCPTNLWAADAPIQYPPPFR